MSDPEPHSSEQKSLSRVRARGRTCIAKGCDCTYTLPVMFGGGLSATVPLCPRCAQHFWDNPRPPHPAAPCGCQECDHAPHSGLCEALVSLGSASFADAVKCGCEGPQTD